MRYVIPNTNPSLRGRCDIRQKGLTLSTQHATFRPMVALNFGKHKGCTLDEVPDDYLDWLIRTREVELATYKAELERRQTAAEADLPLMQRLVTRGYRELAKEFHPDHGGSTADMQELNAAAEALRAYCRKDSR